MNIEQKKDYWKKHKQASLKYSGLLFVSIVFIAIIFFLNGGFARANIFFKILTMLMLLASVIPYIFIVENWPCPNCGKKFFRKGIKYMPSLKCVHCGDEKPNSDQL